MKVKETTNPQKLLIIISAAIAITILIIDLVFILIFSNVIENYISKDGEIVHIVEDGYITVEYKVDDNSYYKDFNFYSGSLDLYDKVTIYYNENDATDVYLKNEMITVMTVLSILGSSFLIMSMITLAIFITNVKKKQYLLEYGNKILAEVISIDINYNFKYGNKSPFYLKCRYKKGKEEIIFKSNYFLENISIGNGLMVTVYYDSPNKYYVDLSTLREKTEMDTTYEFENFFVDKY